MSPVARDENKTCDLSSFSVVSRAFDQTDSIGLTTAALSRLFCQERTTPDPEFRQVLQIFLVGAGYGVFLPAFNP